MRCNEHTYDQDQKSALGTRTPSLKPLRSTPAEQAGVLFFDPSTNCWNQQEQDRIREDKRENIAKRLESFFSSGVLKQEELFSKEQQGYNKERLLSIRDVINSMPAPSFKYAYLVANIFFLVVWVLIFWRVKNLRRPMIIMSLMTSLFGPISEIWYFADYWKPEIVLPLPLIGGVEDLLFGFSIGGIGAFVYEALFVRGICKCEKRKLKREWFLFAFFAIEGLAMIIFNNFLGINSIYASSIGMIITAAIMFYLRPDLIPNAIGSAFLVAGTMFTIYYLGQEFFPQGHLWMERIWKLSGQPQGIIIFKHIPWTEMLWGVSWGLVWGPMYEFLIGARIMTVKSFNILTR